VTKKQRRDKESNAKRHRKKSKERSFIIVVKSPCKDGFWNVRPQLAHLSRHRDVSTAMRAWQSGEKAAAVQFGLRVRAVKQEILRYA